MTSATSKFYCSYSFLYLISTYIAIIIFFLAIYQLNRVQLSSATRERLWARSNHHGLNGSTTAAPVSASSVPISSTGGRNRRLSGNPSSYVYNNPPTLENNGYRSDSSILSNGRTGESSCVYNNGSIQNFSNSQVEGKMYYMLQSGLKNPGKFFWREIQISNLQTPNVHWNMILFFMYLYENRYGSWIIGQIAFSIKQ